MEGLLNASANVTSLVADVSNRDPDGKAKSNSTRRPRCGA